MKIYAISDLHLSFAADPTIHAWQEAQYKPMSEIDAKWIDHTQKIYDNWLSIVQPEDIVLIPGDISWAMRLEQTRWDMKYLELLPGHKIAVQGNHDYWWQSLSKARAAMPATMQLIQNDHVQWGKVAICGSRGWLCPNGVYFQHHDGKIYERELMRMENSLRSAIGAKEIIVMMHYMPTNEKHEYSGFIELFEKYKVSTVVYGHLHGKACHCRLPQNQWGIQFYLVSADYVQFKPRFIQSLEALA